MRNGPPAVAYQRCSRLVDDRVDGPREDECTENRSGCPPAIVVIVGLARAGGPRRPGLHPEEPPLIYATWDQLGMRGRQDAWTMRVIGRDGSSSNRETVSLRDFVLAQDGTAVGWEIVLVERLSGFMIYRGE